MSAFRPKASEPLRTFNATVANVALMAEQNDPLAERAARFRQMPPQLVANVRLYETEKGGRQQAALPGWGCPCMTTQQTLLGYDGWPILEEPLCPGDERDGVAFVFSREKGAR